MLICWHFELAKSTNVNNGPTAIFSLLSFTTLYLVGFFRSSDFLLSLLPSFNRLVNPKPSRVGVNMILTKRKLSLTAEFITCRGVPQSFEIELGDEMIHSFLFNILAKQEMNRFVEE